MNQIVYEFTLVEVFKNDFDQATYQLSVFKWFETDGLIS